MAITTATHVSLGNLSKYDLLLRDWATGVITEKISALGKVLNLKGRVDDTTALNAIEDAKAGDMYMVGAEGADSFEEYYRTDSETWEFMGVTRVSLDGYVTETTLYKGAAGTGTTVAPAAGTALAGLASAIGANTTAIAAINDAETGAVKVAKDYADGLNSAMNGRVTANETAIAAINDADTGILKTAKAYADTLVGAGSDTTAAIAANTAAIAVINNAETGIAATAKNYADGLNTAMAARVATLETAVSDADIASMFETNTASLG